jgi:hypothetical protein
VYAFLSLVLLGVGLAGLVSCSGGSTAAEGDTEAVVSNVPFADGERFAYELRDDHGVVGHGVLSVSRDGDALVLKQDYEEAAVPAGQKATSDRSTVAVDPVTLQPRSVERVVEQRESSDTYDGTYAADGDSVTMSKDDAKARTVELPANAYENESSLWLWRTLPFAKDYQARYVSVNVVERKRQTVELEVTGQQTITVPAGTFNTWRLQVRNGRATRVAWINVDAPHQIVRWDNGSTVLSLEPAVQP